ncbi:MAG: hypothetical protein ABIL25_08410 [candidate division WOR-3 bacterium]
MPAKKGLAAIRIKADANLQAVFGPKKELKPTELMKGLIAYADKKKLRFKGPGKGLAAMRVKTDPALKAIYGAKPDIKWFELMKGLWAYINKNKLRQG